MVRVFINGVDLGTMSAGAAAKLRGALERIDPAGVVRVEPVEDGAPVFAHEAENVSA